jgi:hypothetical protein
VSLDPFQPQCRDAYQPNLAMVCRLAISLERF